MKDLSVYIKEELDNNILWMLDQWFYNNDIEKQEFIDIINKYRNNIDDIESYVNATSSLKNHLQDFVNFINDDISQIIEDYLYAFTNIIKQVIANKSISNKYIQINTP